MWYLAVLWGVVVAAAIAAYQLLSDPPEDARLAKWRAVAAVAFFVGVVATTILVRIDSELHVCEETTVRTVTDEPGGTTVETTEACGSPLDLAHVALLMVPVVGLIAPALSEFTIAGLFAAKIREVAAKEAGDTTTALLVTHELGDTFRSALRASETGEDVGDLPGE